MDWNSKAFRGKTFKTKAASKKLVSRLKALKEEEEEDFAKDSNHEEKEVEFVICSLKSMLSTRPVHMPGYPESVPEPDYSVVPYACFVLQVVPSAVHEASPRKLETRSSQYHCTNQSHSIPTQDEVERPPTALSRSVRVGLHHLP